MNTDKLFERDTVKEVIPSKGQFLKALKEKNFHIYLGIDPTHDKLHLGHVQNILFLKDMGELDARITLLLGSFTGLIGDPTEKNKTRSQLTRKEVRRNIKEFRKQIKSILDVGVFSNTSIKTNEAWFNKMPLTEFFNLLKNMTHQNLIERDMFQDRIKNGNPLYMHELLYPVLQGYDSVAMNVDAELCGSDQLFNALVGRDMLSLYKNKDKVIITMNLLEGEGVLMSKSNGTGVFVDLSGEGHKNMFGEIMSLSDAFILPLFKGCTRIPMDKIREYENMTKGREARDIKMLLAEEIVRMFHGNDKATKAKKSFILQFQQRKPSEDTRQLNINEATPLHQVVKNALKISSSDAKRRIQSGGVKVGDEKIIDVRYILSGEHKGKTLIVGRHIFII